MLGSIVQLTDYKKTWYEEIKPNYFSFDTNLPEYWHMKYRDRYKNILNHIKVMKPKLLDIGCGLGRAMMYFKDLGAEVSGVEPSEYAFSIASKRGLNVINDYFDRAVIRDSFDIIHIEQVLSHMPDYMGTLNRCMKLLNPGGVLVIEEPNDYNALQIALKDDLGEYWITEDHVNYFTFKKIINKLSQVGFDFIKKSCTYPMELFELAGDHYIGDEEAGARVHRKRYEMLSKMGYVVRQKMLDGFADIDLGRDLVVYVRRPK